jgi:membrane associated rhomboid family serine protease
VIPAGDVIPTRTRPVVTWVIATAAVIVAIGIRGVASDRVTEVAARIGLLPTAFSLVRALAATFVHLDWLSLVSNVALLLIAGRTLEDRLGHDRFALLYLLGALAGGTAASVGHGMSFTIVVGAGGAVGALASAYVALFPRSRVLMVVWLPFFQDAVEVPAIVIVAVWACCQLIAAADLFAPAGTGGVPALWSVLGGLVMGAGVAHLLVRRERLRVEWWN